MSKMLKASKRNQKNKVLFLHMFSKILSTLLTLLCLNCPFHMNKHTDKVVYVMFVETVSGWDVTSENISKNSTKFFLFQVGDLNILDIFYKIKNFNCWPDCPVITHWTYTFLSPWALFLISVQINFFLHHKYVMKGLLKFELALWGQVSPT